MISEVTQVYCTGSGELFAISRNEVHLRYVNKVQLLCNRSNKRKDQNKYTVNTERNNLIDGSEWEYGITN